jgi:hypothetical protein
VEDRQILKARESHWVEPEGGEKKPARMDGAQRSQSRMDRSSLRAKSPSLIGTALYGAVRRAVWDPGANHSRGPDSL